MLTSTPPPSLYLRPDQLWLPINQTDDGNSTTPSLPVEEQVDADAELFATDCSRSLGYEVFMIVLFVFGATGNAVSVGVMSRRALRDRSFSLSLIILAALNSLNLLFEAIASTDNILSHYYGSLEEHIGPIGCKLYRYTPAVTSMMDHWVVVFITTERFVAVCFPHALSRLFSDKNSRFIFGIMFFIVACSQLWRPYLDTQEPATFTNDSNGTLVQENAASCTADQLSLYVDIDAFFHQLAMLFFFPAFSILIMNTAVIAKIYHEDRRRALRQRHNLMMRLPFSPEHFRPVKSESNFAKMKHVIMRKSFSSAATLPQMPLSPANSTATSSPYRRGGINAGPSSSANSGTAQDQRIRKATLLLLAITCTFLMYITPHLTLLLYVRFHHLRGGGMEGYKAFLRVCKQLQVTGALATIGYADNFIIQMIFDEKFRREFKLVCWCLLGKCLPPFNKMYQEARQRQRQIKASKYVSDSTAAMLARRRSQQVLAMPSNLQRLPLQNSHFGGSEDRIDENSSTMFENAVREARANDLYLALVELENTDELSKLNDATTSPLDEGPQLSKCNNRQDSWRSSYRNSKPQQMNEASYFPKSPQLGRKSSTQPCACVGCHLVVVTTPLLERRSPLQSLETSKIETKDEA